MPSLAVSLIVSYLVGAIPTALIAGYLLGRIDIRTVGSGNAGATNLYRVFGLKPYLAVLGFDIAKGYVSATVVAVSGAGALDPLQTSLVCGVAAVLGHIFTVFAGFKGGKGVATAAGAMLAVVPIPLLVAVAVYLGIVALTHFVSLGSIGAAVSLPVSLAVARYSFTAEVRVEVWAVSLVLAGVILATHRENIRRLLKGEENKTYFFGKPPEA
ncbi:MAG: glycerol-3-phosphate 1-O-acyltransferase PlsY [Nitrospinae bacterium]|nr:glycerol-3-phosphate 1-O-acyltransferase PlsY [Nitrospinota bacterium]